ncbi:MULTISPECIES: exo-rhamnogalacturonan lyase family protein [unclassified Streptomyces]|uniref:exo-rhamnogalacturonan lyase family protein n=1 Tax=unclassified Streptomyces TaxID=2593676 RepID=UPI00093CD0BA|nr:Tat pathway signal sequence domain protein [Streptomyces sp. CB02058]OKI92679.1 Tat pathway signal sequence domain protein [Streptomyces sp. CB02058]
MGQISRRSVLTSAAAGGAVAWLSSTTAAHAETPLGAPAAAPVRADGHEPVTLRWLEKDAPAELAGGTTWGVPWPAGSFASDQAFSLTTESGKDVPVQSWPTGWWPDGSVKWTAHAISQAAPRSDTYRLSAGAPAAPAAALTVHSGRDQITVNTGVVEVVFPRKGDHVIKSIRRGATVIAKNGHLVASRQDRPGTEPAAVVKSESYTGIVSTVTVEQDGPVRAVVKVEGKHRKGRRAWLPFVVRFYLYAGSDGIRTVHTFVFDGDERKDFISGLGIRFGVPMRGEPHDRHVRFAGQDEGVLAEAVRGITGLRRDPGAAVRTAQYEGRATPDTSTWDSRVTSRLQYIPAFGDYSLRQLNAHGFEIHKRTKPGHSWVRVDGGKRAEGLGYVGSPTGGLAFGMRNFWQLHPTELEIAGAAGAEAQVTVWMWSPRAEAMDLRFYHDGMEQDTYPEQLEGLEITYEDYEPGFGTPYGVARTTELTFWALEATPTAERFAALAAANATPPLLASGPEHNHSAKVFGSWSPVDRSVPAKAEIEDKLQAMHRYHREQVDQRSWYGFWDYGDIMHSYDGDRHTWRYDVGGYAWDNSELSTDLWLWYHYLRTGDAAAFRFAEAMTRHTGEVDMYHIGTYQGLGTRHGVMHWGDSAKQVRISNAGYKRIFYFLTADERVGDVLHELVDSDRSFLVLDPGRKIREGDPFEPEPKAMSVGTTTDWGALAMAWLTEWERHGRSIARTKLVNGVSTLAALPNGWVQSGDITYNLADGKFTGSAEPSVSVGSLSSVFGLIEVMTEIIELVDDDAVKDKWVQFCRLYNASKDEQRAVTGSDWGNLNLRQAYARATAYAAVQLEDDALALRAWKELRTGHAGYPEDHDFSSHRIEGPAVLNPVDEADLSANASAQFGLAAIQCLALVGDKA